MSQSSPMKITHDGQTLVGQASIPEGIGPFPAVLVMHSAVGLNAFYKSKAPLLAAQGWLAVATDMYGGDVDTADAASYGAAYAQFQNNPERLRARVVAWFDAVSARQDVDADRVAAIGYCFGGKCVLELARSGADVKAVVSYHGILGTHAPAQPGAVRGEVAAYCGARDPFAPMEAITALRIEMESAGASYQLTVFGDAEHGFTDPHAAGHAMPGISYNALADKTSWAGTLALLEHVLAG